MLLRPQDSLMAELPITWKCWQLSSLVHHSVMDQLYLVLHVMRCCW